MQAPTISPAQVGQLMGRISDLTNDGLFKDAEFRVLHHLLFSAGRPYGVDRIQVSITAIQNATHKRREDICGATAKAVEQGLLRIIRGERRRIVLPDGQVVWRTDTNTYVWLPIVAESMCETESKLPSLSSMRPVPKPPCGWSPFVKNKAQERIRADYSESVEGVLQRMAASTGMEIEAIDPCKQAIVF